MVEPEVCLERSRFDTKFAASEDKEYSVEKAESVDLKYLVENSCISCNRHLGAYEIKIVPPRYIQERDNYVRKGAVARRLMCVKCYNVLKNVTRTRIRLRDSARSRKSYIFKSVVNNILLGWQQ